jgi:hypothetical protein
MLVRDVLRLVEALTRRRSAPASLLLILLKRRWSAVASLVSLLLIPLRRSWRRSVLIRLSLGH